MFTICAAMQDIDQIFASLFGKLSASGCGQPSAAFSKQLHQAAMFLANHSADQQQRNHLLLMASFDKTSRDMASYLKLIKTMGATLQERLKNDLFVKSEALLMTTLAKWQKFKTAVESGFEQLPSDKHFISKERVAQETEMASQVTQLLEEHAQGALAALKKRLDGIFSTLGPIAGGMDSGKAWAAGVEASCFPKHHRVLESWSLELRERI